MNKKYFLRSTKVIVLFSVIMIAIWSCGGGSKNLKKNPVIPGMDQLITWSSMFAEKIDYNQAKLELRWDLNTKVNLMITGYKYNATLDNGTKYSEDIEWDPPLHFSEGLLPIPITLSLGDNGQQIIEYIKRQSGLLEISITLYLNNGKTHTLKRQVEFALPRLPQLKIITAQAARIGRSGDLTFEFAITNINPFPVYLEQCEYSLALEDVELSRGLIGVEEKIPPNSELRYNVPLKIDSKTQETKVVNFLKQPEIKYLVKGMMKVGKLTILHELPGEIKFGN